MCARNFVALVLICLAVASQFGCAFVPTTNHRLEEAKAGFQHLSALPGCPGIAPREYEQAKQALLRAVDAWNTLQDPALVDHLAYLAKQRTAIVRVTVQKYERATLILTSSAC